MVEIKDNYYNGQKNVKLLGGAWLCRWPDFSALFQQGYPQNLWTTLENGSGVLSLPLFRAASLFKITALCHYRERGWPWISLPGLIPKVIHRFCV
ncbi:hypothetical protein [Alloalcanivorax mobilis]|uniref:hypothetical protein n=1 Tax=Alloalcanivorax mobilis TaxID=2019569 RepID=UPI0012FFE296|nr:hypothetical protein [Alloalcanivorax mobilis]